MQSDQIHSANGAFEIVPGKNDRGEHIFSVIVKRSYRIGHGMIAQRLESDHELRKIDEYYEQGDPEWATLQYEYELAPCKPSVDLVVIGRAYAPKGKATQCMSASVRVADRQKSILVFGDRECHYRQYGLPVFSEPAPFTEMEIRYERAYGGRDEKSIVDLPFLYPRNFMGTGVALRNIREVVERLALPNLEDVDDLLTPERIILGEPERWPGLPIPQGFGWFPRTFYPRCCHTGTYPSFVDVDTVTKEERAGLLPANHIALAKQFRLPSFDARFHNGASFGMLQPDLKGDEKVTLNGLSHDGLLEFYLPGEAPRITLDIGHGEQQLQARLDTVSIRPDDLEIDLIWRGAYVYEGYSWLPHMKRLHAEVH